MRYWIVIILLLTPAAATAFELDGYTDFSRRLDLNSSVSARVARVHVEIGAAVDIGQLLISLDETALAAEVDIARAEMESLAPEVARQQSELVRAQELYDRDSLALITLQRSEQDFVIASARLAAATARLQLAQIRLGQAEIRSPIAGIVLAIESFPGQYVNTEVNDRTLLTIADTQQMIAEALMPIEEMNSRLHNHAARVRYREQFFDARVIQLGRQIRTGANNHPAMTLVVRFRTDGELPAGLPVKILIDE